MYDRDGQTYSVEESQKMKHSSEWQNQFALSMRFFSLRHFGHLYHSSIETCHDTIH